MDTDEVFQCEASMNVFAEMFGGEVFGFSLIDTVYRLGQNYLGTVDFYDV